MMPAPPNFNYIVINQNGQPTSDFLNKIQLGGNQSLGQMVNISSESNSSNNQNVASLLQPQIFNNGVPQKKKSSVETPKGQTAGFLTPSVVNKAEGGINAPQTPSMEVTPTNYLVGGSHLKKHNSFYDEWARLNANNALLQNSPALAKPITIQNQKNLEASSHKNPLAGSRSKPTALQAPLAVSNSPCSDKRHKFESVESFGEGAKLPKIKTDMKG